MAQCPPALAIALTTLSKGSNSQHFWRVPRVRIDLTRRWCNNTKFQRMTWRTHIAKTSPESSFKGGKAYRFQPLDRDFGCRFRVQGSGFRVEGLTGPPSRAERLRRSGPYFRFCRCPPTYPANKQGSRNDKRVRRTRQSKG